MNWLRDAPVARAHGMASVQSVMSTGQGSRKRNVKKRAWISIPTCMASAVLRDSNNFEALL